jgi:DNA replication and repair protein RecF
MGSQGEIRSALLALKFSEIDHFKEVTGHSPILLLDDLSSELDLFRREKLLKYLGSSDLQVFVTSTEEQNIFGKKFYFEKSGVLKVL